MPSKQEITKEIKNTIAKYLDLKKNEIFIFGSQAKLKKFKAADIDIGIKGDKTIKFELFNQIKSDLNDINTLHPIDLVDFSNIDANFKHIAESKMEIL